MAHQVTLKLSDEVVEALCVNGGYEEMVPNPNPPPDPPQLPDFPKDDDDEAGRASVAKEHQRLDREYAEALEEHAQPVPNPQSKEEFAQERIEGFVRSQFAAYELSGAHVDAEESARKRAEGLRL